jgi:hypothetical protein
MYERMLQKQTAPTVADMAAYCGENGGFFTALNQWITGQYGTAQEIVFPYGNHYGWGIAHRAKKKLICTVFPEDAAFTVMIRLSNGQFDSVYGDVLPYTRDFIDHKYPCGDGGWIHYRVLCKEHVEDIQKLMAAKVTGRK